MKAAWIDPFLPAMRCDSGCGECCGIAPASQGEFDSVAAYAKANGIVAKRQGVICPFFQEGTCAVYEARPSVCRFFGHTECMVCPRGYNVNVSPGVEKFIAITLNKQQLRSDRGRVLHELAYTRAELAIMGDEIIGPSGQEWIPVNLDYHFVMSLSLMGVITRPMVFLDKTTGEMISTGMTIAAIRKKSGKA